MVHHRFIVKAVTITAIAIAVNAVDFAKGSFHSTVNAALVPFTLSVSPTAVVGGNQVTATIGRTSTNGEMEVKLESLNAQVADFGSSSTLTRIKIPNGSANTTVPVRTFGVAGRTNVTLRATVGSDVAEVTLTVNPASVKSLSISPAKVIGGANATGMVTLDGLAPSNAGVAIQLSLVREADSRTSTTNNLLPFIEQSTSPATSPISIASSITVPPGGSSATFAINTTPVTVDTSIRIDARKSDGSVREAATRISDGTSNTIAVGELTSTAASARLTVSAPAPGKLLLSPSSVAGGAGVIGTVVLTGRAPVGGVLISLFESTSPAGVNVATVPKSLTVPAGTDRQDFKITTNTTSSAQSVTIIAAVGTNNLKQLSPGSQITDGTSNTISLGDGSVRSLPATSAATATLYVTPTPPPFTIAVQPAQVIGGAPVTITLTVQPTASSTANSIALASNHPELLPVPATVPIGSANTLSSASPSAVVNATTNTASADQNVTITATGFSTTAAATLLVKQTPVPPPVVSISATQPNASKDGPVNGIVTVTRSGASSQSLTVTYSINDPNAGTNPHPAVNGVDFQQLSGQVVIPAGSLSATITVIPISDNKHGPELRLILQLLTPSNGSYTIQSGSSQATVKINQHQGQ